MPRFVKTYGKCKARKVASTAWLSPDIDSGNIFSSPDIDQDPFKERNAFFGRAAQHSKKHRGAKPTSFSSFFDGSDDEEDKENLVELTKRPLKGRQQNKDARKTPRGNNTKPDGFSSGRLSQKGGTKRRLPRYPRKLRQDDGALCDLGKKTLPPSSSSGDESTSSWHPSGSSSKGSSSSQTKSSNCFDITEVISDDESGDRELKTDTPEAKRARSQRNTRQRFKNDKRGQRVASGPAKSTSTPVSVYHSAYSSIMSPVLFDASMEGVAGHISEEEEDELSDSVFGDVASISRNLDLMNFEDDTDPPCYKTCPGDVPPEKAPSKEVAPREQGSIRSTRLKDLSGSTKSQLDQNGPMLAKENPSDAEKNGGPHSGINVTYIIKKRDKDGGNSSEATGSGHSSEGGKRLSISKDSDMRDSRSRESKESVDSSHGGYQSRIHEREGKTSNTSSKLHGSNYSSRGYEKLGNSGDTSIGSSELFGSDHSIKGSPPTGASEMGDLTTSRTNEAESGHSDKLGEKESTCGNVSWRSTRSSEVVGGGEEERLLPCSVKLIRVSPAELSTPPRAKEMSQLLMDGYGSFRDSLTPTKERKSGQIITARTKVLQQCGQTEPLPFSGVLSEEELSKCVKVGEGAYGEVFLTVNALQESVALKIIPIEGDFAVNDEPQKTFEEILPEIVISRELSSLQTSQANQTDNFIWVNRVACIQGSYPQGLLEEWDAYDERKGSENEKPDMFDENQLFILFEFADGGKDLEELELSDVKQAVSLLQQVAGALAAAECQYSFEHRDLHWGNILIRETKDAKASFTVEGDLYEVCSHGVEVSIIDFTLSRLEKEGCTVFCELASDETLFTGKGDYQFDIYRKMKKENKNDWEAFNPHSNVLWLHYLLEKLTSHKTYKRPPSKETLRELKTFGRHLLSCSSAQDVLKESELLQLLDCIG